MTNKYTGDEHFSFDNMPSTFLLSDFYSWLSSDMATTAVRNLLAEYIVSTALGIENDCKSYPCLYYGEKSISVTSACYIQPAVEHLLSPTFKTTSNADITIFCLHEHLNRKTADLMKLEQWTFFITDKKVPDNQPLTVADVKSLCLYMVKYNEIKGAIDKL